MPDLPTDAEADALRDASGASAPSPTPVRNRRGRWQQELVSGAATVLARRAGG